MPDLWLGRPNDPPSPSPLSKVHAGGMRAIALPASLTRTTVLAKICDLPDRIFPERRHRVLKTATHKLTHTDACIIRGCCPVGAPIGYSWVCRRTVETGVEGRGVRQNNLPGDGIWAERGLSCYII